MLTSAGIFTGYLLVALILPTDDVQRTKEHLKAATQFEFQGIGFGSTGADIKKKWPKCEQSTVFLETDKNRKDDYNFLLINVERFRVPKTVADIPAEYV